jgi:hypothetical protein
VTCQDGGVTSFVAGSDNEGSIPDFLAPLPGGLDARWLLVTHLDSGPPDPESRTIRRGIATFAEDVEWTPAGLLVPGHRLRAAACEALFHGFDEVVVFDVKPLFLAPLPMSLTSDRSLSDDARRQLLTYLETTGALAAAGDGAGLNWFLRRDVLCSTLTEGQAFEAMRHFLTAFWERGGSLTAT